MTAANASTSPHSSVSFTPFGSDAFTLAGEEKGAIFPGSDRRTSSRLAGKSDANADSERNRPPFRF
jgi:hypothetical protein